jgi:hypothetical protein
MDKCDDEESLPPAGLGKHHHIAWPVTQGVHVAGHAGIEPTHVAHWANQVDQRCFTFQAVILGLRVSVLWTATNCRKASFLLYKNWSLLVHRACLRNKSNMRRSIHGDSFQEIWPPGTICLSPCAESAKIQM